MPTRAGLATRPARRQALSRDDGPVTDAADLLSPAGHDLLRQLSGVAVTPETALRLGAGLRKTYPAGLVAAALTQQSLRMAARDKFSDASQMYFTRDGLEQASAELVAAHSARRFAGSALVADLCCGIGGDLVALARVAGQVLAVDTDPDALAFAAMNAAVTGATATVTTVCQDVREVTLDGVEAVFIDPARRAAGRRLRTGDSEPPLDWCLALADRVPRVCIKAAPGLAHALIPAGWEAEFVAAGRGLKEALLWSPAFATTPRRATVLPGSLRQAAGPRAAPSNDITGASAHAGDAGGVHPHAAGGSGAFPSLVAFCTSPAPVGEPGRFLLDPNPAVTRAGLVAELAAMTGTRQIDPQIAFLAADEPVVTPFARTLRVIDSMPWHERRVAARLRELRIGAADLRRRGLAGDVQQIHRNLRLHGDQAATIVLTRRDNRPWCLICEAVTDPAAPDEPGPDQAG